MSQGGRAMIIVDATGHTTEVTRRRDGAYVSSNPRLGDLLLVNPATRAPVPERELAIGTEVAVVSGSGTSPLTFKVT